MGFATESDQAVKTGPERTRNQVERLKCASRCSHRPKGARILSGPERERVQILVFDRGLKTLESQRTRPFCPFGITVPLYGIVAAMIDGDRVGDVHVRELADAAMLGDAPRSKMINESLTSVSRPAPERRRLALPSQREARGHARRKQPRGVLVNRRGSAASASGRQARKALRRNAAASSSAAIARLTRPAVRLGSDPSHAKAGARRRSPGTRHQAILGYGAGERERRWQQADAG